MLFGRKCPKCNGRLKRNTFTTWSDVFRYLAFEIGFFIGILCLIFIPTYELVIGGIIFLLTLFLGTMIKGEYLCKKCGLKSRIDYFGKR